MFFYPCASFIRSFLHQSPFQPIHTSITPRSTFVSFYTQFRLPLRPRSPIWPFQIEFCLSWPLYRLLPVNSTWTLLTVPPPHSSLTPIYSDSPYHPVSPLFWPPPHSIRTPARLSVYKYMRRGMQLRSCTLVCTGCWTNAETDPQSYLAILSLHCPTGWLTDWVLLDDWLSDWLTGWLTGCCWITDWITD